MHREYAGCVMQSTKLNSCVYEEVGGDYPSRGLAVAATERTRVARAA